VPQELEKRQTSATSSGIFTDQASALFLCFSPFRPAQFLRRGDPAPGSCGNLSSFASGAESPQSLVDLEKLSSETRAFSLKLL
jgi:hypothetical protein